MSQSTDALADPDIPDIPEQRRANRRRADRPIRREAEGAGRLPKFPSTKPQRWVLRIAIAAPFILMTLLLQANAPEYFTTKTANAAFLHHLDAVRNTPAGIGTLAALYPPLSTLLGLILPGGVLGMAIAASLGAGFFGQRVIEWLVRRRLSVPGRIGFIILVLATPLFGFLITTNMEISAGLMLFGLGMIDLVRFVVYANTQAGFRAGLYFATAALAAPAFVAAVIIVAVFAPFMALSRRGSRSANTLVVVFPTLIAFGSVLLIGTMFQGAAFAGRVFQGFGFTEARIANIGALFSGPFGWLYVIPTVVGVGLAFLLRRPVGALAPILMTGSTLLLSMVGILPAGSAGTGFMMLVLTAVALVPRPARGADIWVIRIALISQILVAYLLSLLVFSTVTTWLHALVGGL